MKKKITNAFIASTSDRILLCTALALTLPFVKKKSLISDISSVNEAGQQNSNG